MGDQQCCVYKLINKAGEVIYIGSTSNLDNRLANHRWTQAWWSEVNRVETTNHPDRKSAYVAESEAIYKDQPKYNTRGKIGSSGPGGCHLEVRLHPMGKKKRFIDTAREYDTDASALTRQMLSWWMGEPGVPFPDGPWNDKSAGR